MKKTIYLLSIILILIALTSCVKKDDTYYKVSFETNGGSEIESIVTKENTKINKPIDPRKEGYNFEYWLLDGEKYDFNTLVTKDMTLKAKWNKIEEEPEDIYYDVTFDSNGGSNVSSQNIKENNKVIKPSNPIKEGYTFEYWLLDGEKYDFNTLVTRDMTLKAKWNKIEEEPEDIYYDVTFDSNGGSNVSSQSIKENNKVVKPSNPIKEGYVFIGWYLDNDFLVKYDFNTFLDKDLILYARFEDSSDDLDVSDWFN